MAYKTLGGGLDLSLSMESKSNSLPLMMSAGGRFGGIFKGFWGRIFEHPEVKRRQISPFGVRNPVFCGGKTLRCYFRIYGGDFLWSGYMSESYASFCLFFTLLRILAPGTLKTRVNRCFCSSNDRRKACLACRCSQTPPQSYAFSLKSLRFPPVFWGVRESWREGFFNLLTNVKCKEWRGWEGAIELFYSI